MQRSRQSIEAFMQRLKNGDCTQDEIRLFRKWIAELDLTDGGETLSPEWLAEVKARMHQQLMLQIKGVPVVAIKRIRLLRRYAAAAAIVLTFSSGILIWYLKSRQGTAVAQTASTLSVIENDRNVVRKVTMPDGTIVWLNRNSRLEFDDQQYNQTERYVKLSGEGFFEVAKDATRPFIVETGQLHTRVLGTAFNIEAYQQESEIRVSLVHGKIALENKATSDTAILHPDQMIRYSRETREWELMPVAVGNISAWTTGALVFNEVPLKKHWSALAAGLTW
ncbi:FecR family protein [Paraflavitalea speifideaquila]|uniref:FecR family protein n=1 Tax=Paraflavitalea speifideaquila TaxID=3076558 RepID=UPI0028E3090A|nr:FecR domain-containing protein [Paraflavitalea speifideiaquila]